MVAFIGQGFNTVSESTSELFDTSLISSLGDAIEASLNDPSFDQVRLLVAFATDAGVKRLLRMSQNSKINAINVYVGVDENITTKDALERLFRNDITGFVYHGKTTYHPKIYYFEGEERIRAIVGSGNLTEGGLYSNYEASLIVETAKDDDSNRDIISDLKDYLDSVEQHGNELSEKLIQKLDSDGKIKTEEEKRRERTSDSDPSILDTSGSGRLDYQADVSRQIPPPLPSSKITDAEVESEDGEVTLEGLDESLLMRANMPDIPEATSFKTKTDRDYYKQLISKNDNQVNFIRRIIREKGEITKGDLKEILREDRGAAISGSFDADLRVLWRTTNEIERTGRGDDQLLTWIGE